MSALIEQKVIDRGEITEVIETWDLNHPDCPEDVLSEVVDDDDAFVAVVSTFFKRTIH